MKEKRESIKKFFEEVKSLILGFLHPPVLKEELFTMPKDVKRMGVKLQVLALVITVVNLVFAFVLKWSNFMIEQKMIILGIFLFMLYKGQSVVDVAFRLVEQSEKEKMDLINEDEIVTAGTKLSTIVSNRIFKYNSKDNQYKLLEDESIYNTLKSYIKNSWSIQIIYRFNIVEILCVIMMLVVAIITNTVISQAIFIPLLLFFAVVSFFSSVYISLCRKDYYTQNKEINNKQALIRNDLLRVPSIIKKDAMMRIKKYRETNELSKTNINCLHKKLNKTRLLVTILETCSQYGFIVLYLLKLDISEITLATITEIAANLAIVSTALGNLSKISRIFNNFNEKKVAIEKEIEDIEMILTTYNTEIKKLGEDKPITELVIKPFEIKYCKGSENDKPFTLVSNDEIRINNGEIAVLHGPSGSGKSTFMNLLTDRIRVEKSSDVPSTTRFMIYDEKLRFGSLSLFEELFCLDHNPNLDKMQNIMENLHLWQEISSTCVDVWQWMKEKNFKSSLSNGQKQRIILAKMLYWLDTSIDVIVLDECTSGLDDKSDGDSADAERILEYIIKYCNQDKKRIIVISTHQNIDGMKNKLMNEFKFVDFKFRKNPNSNKNYITQV